MKPLEADFPTVLFPIEILTRELNSKLIMAAALAAKGCRAVVGYDKAIRVIGAASANVVWQGKSVFKTRDGGLADHLTSKGSAIMFIHDEGGIYQVDAWQNYALEKHEIDRLRKSIVSRICVWGERQKNFLSSYAEELKHLIAVTGSPMFDLCLPEYAWICAPRSKALRDEYGPLILICTRFTDAVHSKGQSEWIGRMESGCWPQTLSQEKLIDLSYSKWQRNVHDFADFVVLTKELSRNFPQHTMVLRPHPSENLAFYQRVFASLKNVIVTREDSVQSWIHAAELVVHSNCTTGIEAVLMDRPVLNLLPESSGREELDVEVAREAGHVVRSIKEAIQRAGDLLSGETYAHGWSPQAKATLNNLTDAAIPKMATETLDVIQKQGLTSSELVLPKETKIRDAVRRIVKRADDSYPSSQRGSLNADHVASIIDGYRDKYGAGGKIRHITEKFVVIDPA